MTGNPAEATAGAPIDIPRITEVFEHGRERHLHHGLQICVLRDGHIVLDCALGDAEPGVPLTTEHWLPWLSAGKPLTAAAIAQLLERRQLELDDRVGRFIPAFATVGKADITIRHLLTHTAGLRNVDSGWPDCPWEDSIARICVAPIDPDAIPGETAGYHVTSSWFLLGEILQRICQQPFTEVLWKEVFEPCEMTETAYCLSEDVRRKLGDRLAPFWERDRTELKRLDWEASPRIERPSPGSSVRGPIRQLTRFYEMLRCAGSIGPRQVLQPETVESMTSRHREGQFDTTLGHTIDFGLGLIIDSNRYGAETVPYGYGQYASSRTFGHGGAQSSQGFCDPEARLVVAYVFNGRPGEAQHSRRCRALNEAIYQDLGLA